MSPMSPTIRSLRWWLAGLLGLALLPSPAVALLWVDHLATTGWCRPADLYSGACMSTGFRWVLWVLDGGTLLLSAAAVVGVPAMLAPDERARVALTMLGLGIALSLLLTLAMGPHLLAFAAVAVMGGAGAWALVRRLDRRAPSHPPAA